jgi:predicted metalloendopeptidase
VIRAEKWIAPSTKAYALKKLAKTRTVVGAVEDAIKPDKLDKRYSAVKLEPTNSYRQMAVKIVLNNARRSFMNVVQPTLYTLAETMRTTAVNAMNIPDENLICESHQF